MHYSEFNTVSNGDIFKPGDIVDLDDVSDDEVL